MVIVIEVAGFALLAAAALLFDLTAGLAICGLLLLAVGYLVDAADVSPRLPRPRLPRRRKPAEK